MYFVGMDIGGTGIQVGVVNEQGKILAKSSIVTRIDIPFADQVANMVQCTRDTVAKANLTLDDIQSIGIGIPGITDPRTGRIPFCTNLRWVDVDLKTEFQKHIYKPVYIDNDATVAGLAESVAGVSAGTSSSVFLTLGTGVGGAIILGGKVWSGFHGVGGEIGHMILVSGGEPCTCGNRGCLERYCSATAIIRMARETVDEFPGCAIMDMAKGNKNNINAKIVIDAAKAGDPAGVKIFGQYVQYLGQALASVVNFLDPEIIVLGGGVSKAGDFLLDAVRAEVPKCCLYKAMPISRIELAELGPDAGIIGAAMLGH